MKPITEEQRQYTMPVLSEKDRENQISNIKSLIDKITADCAVGWTSGREYLLPLQIALASLTAIPLGWGVVGNIFPTLEEALKPGYIGTPEPIYEAPPMPEIKFPDKDKLPGWARNHEDAIDWYHSEIKRLNGLGE